MYINNDNSRLVSLIQLSKGGVFFGRTMDILDSKTLCSLKKTCKTMAGMKSLNKLIETERCVDLFRTIGSAEYGVCKKSMEFLVAMLHNFDFVVSNDLESILNQVLCARDFIYSMDINNCLPDTINFEYVIDDMTIKLLTALRKINQESVKKGFIKNLVSLNFNASQNSSKGFDLLKKFTIETIKELNKEELTYFHSLLIETPLEKYTESDLRLHK